MKQVPNTPLPSSTALGGMSCQCPSCGEIPNHPGDELEELLRNSRGVLTALHGCYDYDGDCRFNIADEFVLDSIIAVCSMIEKSQFFVSEWLDTESKKYKLSGGHDPDKKELWVTFDISCDRECSRADCAKALEGMLWRTDPISSPSAVPGDLGVYQIERFEIMKGVCNG